MRRSGELVDEAKKVILIPLPTTPTTPPMTTSLLGSRMNDAHKDYELSSFYHNDLEFMKS